MVTGIDLIKSQIRVASGEPLPFVQSDIVARGACIECRINAEDPKRNFQPSPGRIEKMFVPGGFGVRFDSHVHPGYLVSPHYDSMIGKLIVHQPTRREAIDCMLRALDEVRVEGIQTTIPLHREILRHAAFVEGRIDTTFIERSGLI
jgi:acetyl-CoA carboxylase biotin carboxylase subunit